MKTQKILIIGIAAFLLLAAVVGGLLALRAKFDRINARAEDIVSSHISPGGTTYWRIEAGAANAWLIPCDGGYLLVDTGYPEDYGRFQEGMAAAGLDPKDIRYLFVTHAHDEHAGFAAALKRDTGCRLILPETSLPGLASGRFDWQGVTVNPAIHVLGQLYNAVKQRDFSFEPVIPSEDDTLLRGRSSDLSRELGVEGTFVATPGHSADSWSLVLDDGTAIVGDAAMNTLLPFGAGYRPIFMEDRRQVYDSMELLKSAGAVWILTGHGPAFSAEKLPEFLDQTAAGPGLSRFPEYFLRLSPGFILIILLLVIGKKGNAGFRVFLYILGFILMRDLMIPMGFWTIGSDPVFWLRWAADGKLLFMMAGGSFMISGLIFLRERKAGQTLTWFRGFPLWTVLAGIGGAVLVTLPLILMYRGILSGERGGAMPLNLIPAVLAVSLAGNLLEEILFRGYFQNWCLAQGAKPVQAAVMSGLFFGLCHVFLAYTVTSAGLPLILFATFEGILCGLLKEKFGFTAAVLTHGLAISILTLV